jgi:hypothetical protein
MFQVGVQCPESSSSWLQPPWSSCELHSSRCELQGFAFDIKSVHGARPWQWPEMRSSELSLCSWQDEGIQINSLPRWTPEAVLPRGFSPRGKDWYWRSCCEQDVRSFQVLALPALAAGPVNPAVATPAPQDSYGGLVLGSYTDAVSNSYTNDYQ